MQEQQESVDRSGSSCVMRTCCHRHGFESYRKKCPYCEIEAAFHLAIGSRDSLRDWVEIMRPKLHPDDSTLDQIVDNLDRIAEIVKQVEKDA